MEFFDSEPALSYFGKHIYTTENGVMWDPQDLDDIQRSAALAHAEARLTALEIEYRFIEHGFDIRDFADLEAEISAVVVDEPAIRAVWPLWEYPGGEINGFYRMMNRILAAS